MSDDRAAVLARRRRFLIVALAGVGCANPIPAVPPTKPVASAPTTKRAPEPKPAPKPVDSDGDGVPDESDRCPMAHGIGHGDPDELGCPPRPCLMIVAPQEIVVTQQIFFPRNVAKLSPSAFSVLDELLQILVGHPELVLEIQGHTEVGETDHIALERAKAVRAHLVKKGVAEERMTVQSYGDTRPFYAEKEENRRVSFALREK
jgi:OmpA-OmpF porin, OOP family